MVRLKCESNSFLGKEFWLIFLTIIQNKTFLCTGWLDPVIKTKRLTTNNQQLTQCKIELQNFLKLNIPLYKPE